MLTLTVLTVLVLLLLLLLLLLQLGLRPVGAKVDELLDFLLPLLPLRGRPRFLGGGVWNVCPAPGADAVADAGVVRTADANAADTMDEAEGPTVPGEAVGGWGGLSSI